MDRLLEVIMGAARDHAHDRDQLQTVLTEIAAGALFIASANDLPIRQMANSAMMIAANAGRS